MSFATAALPGETADEAEQRWPQAVQEGKTEDLCALGAKRNACGEFVCALGNEISENTVDRQRRAPMR